MDGQFRDQQEVYCGYGTTYRSSTLRCSIHLSAAQDITYFGTLHARWVQLPGLNPTPKLCSGFKLSGLGIQGFGACNSGLGFMLARVWGLQGLRLWAYRVEGSTPEPSVSSKAEWGFLDLHPQGFTKKVSTWVYNPTQRSVVQRSPKEPQNLTPGLKGLNLRKAEASQGLGTGLIGFRICSGLSIGPASSGPCVV